MQAFFLTSHPCLFAYIYAGVDGEQGERVSLWNTVKECRVAGGNAPYRKDLAEYLSTRPEYEVYCGQEPKVVKEVKEVKKPTNGSGNKSHKAGAGNSHKAKEKDHLGVDGASSEHPKGEKGSSSSSSASASGHTGGTNKPTHPPKSSSSSSGGGTNQSHRKSLSESVPSSSSSSSSNATGARNVDSLMLSPIPLWNSRRKSCLSGRNAPCRNVLAKFLAARPEYEIYTGQDLHGDDDDDLTRVLALSIAGDDAPQLSYASERIAMWDAVALVKIEGIKALLQCDTLRI